MSWFLLGQTDPAITAAVSGAGTEDLGQTSQPPHWPGLGGGAGVLQQDVRRPPAAGGGGGGVGGVRLDVLLGRVGGDQLVVLLAFPLSVTTLCKAVLRLLPPSHLSHRGT